MEKSLVSLVGTSLTSQALSWFCPLFEKKSPILYNFEIFLAASAKAFEEHNKISLGTTIIHSLQQGVDSRCAYVSTLRTAN